MAKDSRGNQWITSDQAVRLFEAVAKLEMLHDFTRANDTIREAWDGISDVMEEIRES